MVVGSQELHDVGVITGGQDLDLHDVVLQLLLALRLDHFGGGQGTRLLVLGLRSRETGGQRGVLSGNLPPEASWEAEECGNRGRMSSWELRGWSRRNAVPDNGQCGS